MSHSGVAEKLTLRHCRQEARALPDVMISGYDPEMAANTAPASTDRQRRNTAELPRANVKASPRWIRQFMNDFLELRLALQRYLFSF